MRKRRIWLNIVGVTIILICLGCIGLAIKANESVELMIAIVSLGVALDESIRNWITTNLIIKEHFNILSHNSQISWLQKALISQENEVRLTKIVFQMKNQKPLTDQNGNRWVHNYEEIIETSFFKNIPEKDPQNRTDSLVANIRELLI